MYHHNMQNNTTDCGIAVLRTVLQQHKRSLSQSDFSFIEIGKEQGLSFSDLSKILKVHGIIAGIYEVSDAEELRRIRFPAIALVDRKGINHYVVIHEYSEKKGFVVSDPALTEISEVSFSDFKSIFSGYILLVEDVHKESSTKRAKNELYINIVKELSFANKTKYASLSILKWGIPVLLLYAMQYLLMYQVEKITAQNMILITILFALSAIIYYYISIIFYEEKASLSEKVSQKMVIDYLIGEIERCDDKRVSTDVEGIFWNIVISVSGILQKFFFKVDLAVIAGAIIVLSIIDWRYTVLVGSFLGIICVCCYFSRLKIKNEQVALIGASSEVSICVQEMTQSSTDLKVFSNISTVEDYCSSVYKRYASAQSRLGKNETKLMSKYEMYSFIFMVLGLAVMLFSYINAIPVSASNTTIAFYMSIFMLMLFRPTLQKWIEYQKSTNAIEYIEFIKQPRRKQNSVRKINAKSVESIQLKDISVSFGNLKIFENINITIQPGVTVGIKGVNGAGKTTLAKLLLGLLTPTSGTFCINSTEKFSTLQNSNITDYVGLFSADMYIYSSSVSNNIAFNIFNDKAASKSISHLNQLPEDFLLFFNGINISQGERQKVLLDRCLQHEKDIYVFDEPDTNLDFNSQREIIKIFDELKKRGKAVVIISHNEHTLDCCDKFYSLENGKIIEQE